MMVQFRVSLDPAETNKQDLGILMAGGQLNKEEANV